MSRERDPIQRVADDARDLYDVVSWEERTRLDGLSRDIYRGLLASARAVVVLLAVLILLAQILLVGVATVDNPTLGAFILLSVVPALALAAYVHRADVTSGEPLGLLLVTFMLGFLLAGFAALLNGWLQPGFANVPLVGMALFFFLVVGPVEETVKWLAVRLFAYRSDSFDAVVDGAVYGAFAGLGFATIENSLYITQEFLNASGAGGEVMLGAAFQTAAARTFAGPGHVIYSGFAGYYLGLAKFNPDNRGPIVIKGLLIATLIHGLYNTAVTYMPVAYELSPALATIPPGVAFIGFVVAYDGLFGYLLYRKLARYRSVYRELDAGDREEADPDVLPSREEWEPETGRKEAVADEAGEADERSLFDDRLDAPSADRGTDDDARGWEFEDPSTERGGTDDDDDASLPW